MTKDMEEESIETLSDQEFNKELQWTFDNLPHHRYR